MNKIYLFFTIIIVSVSCTSSTNKIDKTEIANYIRPHDLTNQDSISSTRCKEIVKNDYVIKITPDFTLSSFVFDTLSQEEKKRFINHNQGKIDLIVSSNFGRYTRIKDGDSIFDILVSCRIDSVKYKVLIPFNVYVLKELSSNKQADGYIGEFITDMYYCFFRIYPGYFYQYMNYLDNEPKYKDYKKGILYNVMYGFYFNDMSSDNINNVFNEHRKVLEKNKTQINLIQQDIIKYQKNM